MKQDISQKKKGIDFGYDSIVIKKHITDIEGGRTLDMTDYPENVLYAGHVIISQVVNEEKVYKPMPVKVSEAYTAVADTTGKNPKSEGWYVKSGENYVATTDTTPQTGTTYYVKGDVTDEDGNKAYEYDTLPNGASYEGVLYRSILKEKPAASILIDGVVNDKVMKIELGAIENDFKAACPHIIFNHDEEA
jgi:hypothetical protein